MEKMPFSKVPDENQIEAMLSEIKPMPTPRLESMMRHAPWQKTVPAGSRGAWKPTRRLAWGLAGLVLVVLFLSVLFIPSVRGIARQIIYNYLFAPSNQLEVQVTLASPADLYNFSDPANFPLSIQEAQQEGGFNLKLLTNLPEGLRFIGSRFDQKFYSVTMLYEGLDYQLFLTQRPQGNGSDMFGIGSDAEVKLVSIGESQGEFVTGGWEAVSTQPVAPQTTPGSTVNIQATWDNSLPQATLRWQAGGYIYELRSLGEGGLSESELINLANGLK